MLIYAENVTNNITDCPYQFAILRIVYIAISFAIFIQQLKNSH